LVEVSALPFVKTAISPTDVSCTPSSSWIAALISSALSSGNACAKRSDCGGESLVPEHSDCGGKSSVPEHSGFGGRSSVPRHVDGGVIESTSCMFVEWVSAVAFGEGVGNVGWATGVGSVAWATIAGPGGVAEVAVLFSAAPESMTSWMIRAPLGILDGVGIIDWAMIVGSVMLGKGWGRGVTAEVKNEVRLLQMEMRRSGSPGMFVWGGGFAGPSSVFVREGIC
jgi:hypothetical protein